MFSLQNAQASRNRWVKVVQFAMIISLFGALLMVSSVSTTKVGAQGQSATAKFSQGRAADSQ